MAIQPVSIGSAGAAATPAPSGLSAGAGKAPPDAAIARPAATASARPASRDVDTATQPLQRTAQSEQKSRAEQVSEAMSKVERAIQPLVTDISFSIHDKTGDVVVRIVDRESQEVIRQIPSEEMLRIAEQLEASGASVSTPGLLLTQQV